MTDKRRELASLYHELFSSSGLTKKNIRLPRQAPDSGHVYHQYTIAIKERDQLQQHLKEHGIGSTVYYPLPLHLQGVFSDLGCREGDFPQAERAAREVLSLPMFPELAEEEVMRVVEAVVEFHER